jgi:hypothetical protein
MYVVICFICRSSIDASDMHNMNCSCPFGSPVCSTCRSIGGQRLYPGSTVCDHCSKKGKEKCEHARPLQCLICSKTGRIHYPSVDFHRMVLAWFSLRKNQSLFRRNEIFAMMARDWNMFSRFYYQNYCLTMMVNPWTQPKKQAFFQLWLLSQMNYPVGPRRMMQICSNLWESYPFSRLHISSHFCWRFRRFPWVRKLISKIAVSIDTSCDVRGLFRQSFLHSCSSSTLMQRMMLFIIQYLMAQHAEIFELTF